MKSSTIFCLLAITLLTSFFFSRSVVIRKQWFVPTFLSSSSPHRDAPATALHFVNNWLKEGAFNLRFCTYTYPASVETPTLDQRGFYASYPPGVVLPIFVLFKMLDATGVVPNIYDERGTQLTLVILINYALHLLLTLVLALMVFFIGRTIGFDNLNSTILAIIPSIVQFHNADSLYFHHLSFFPNTVAILPFVGCIFLETLRTMHIYPKATRVLYPFLLFWGTLTSWLFIFFILTVYIMRIVRKEIPLPISLPQCLRWIKNSFLFFAPSLLAIGLWVSQIIYYAKNIAKTNLSDIVITGNNRTFLENFLLRTGITDGIDGVIQYWINSLFVHTYHGYGISGTFVIYATFFITIYIAIRRRKLVSQDTKANSITTTVCLMLTLPCFATILFFAQNFSEHKFSSLLLSPALSVSFVFAPIFILQMMKKNYLMPAIHLSYGKQKTITAVASLGLLTSILYAYTQTYNAQSVTKMFSRPATHHVYIGNFIKKNTTYNDVVFAKDYTAVHNEWPTHRSHFANKLIHQAENLNQVYDKVKPITADFNIKILYLETHTPQASQLTTFLDTHEISAENIRQHRVGGLLSLSGKEFSAWYERVCDTNPELCEGAKIP